jgi:dipeptidyl aminopeptidase/acylaminoacyl peptidase
VTYVDAKDLSFLLIADTEDRTVPAEQSQALHDSLRARNVGAELLLLPGIDHSFLGPTHDATRESNLTALRRTIAFVDQTIGDRRP